MLEDSIDTVFLYTWTAIHAGQTKDRGTEQNNQTEKLYLSYILYMLTNVSEENEVQVLSGSLIKLILFPHKKAEHGDVYLQSQC